MTVLRIRFVNAGGVSSAIIRAAQLGFVYTHVEAVVPRGYLGAHPRGGVAIRPVGYDGPRAIERFFDLEVTADQAKRYSDFLRHQLGKGYDYAAIVDFALAAVGIHRGAAGAPWRDLKRWDCSALITAALIHAGILPAGFVADARYVTPECCAMAIGALAAARVVPAA